MSLSDTALVTLVQAKNYLRVDAAASLRIDAEYVGVGDAEETVEFTLDHTPVEGSLKLYLDNELQVEPTHFGIADATITFVTAPPDGDIITASYDRVWEAGDDPFESYDDLLLENLIAAATKKAEDHTGRAFIQREITETHIGDGTQILKLYKQPVVDVTSITVGGDALTDWSERLSIGRIYHLIAWTLDYEIVVVYTAGSGATRAAAQVLIPDAVAFVLQAVAFLYENRTASKSQSITGVGAIDYGELEGLPKALFRQLDSLKVNIL